MAACADRPVTRRLRLRRHPRVRPRRQAIRATCRGRLRASRREGHSQLDRRRHRVRHHRLRTRHREQLRLSVAGAAVAPGHPDVRSRDRLPGRPGGHAGRHGPRARPRFRARLGVPGPRLLRLRPAPAEPRWLPEPDRGSRRLHCRAPPRPAAAHTPHRLGGRRRARARGVAGGGSAGILPTGLGGTGTEGQSAVLPVGVDLDRRLLRHAELHRGHGAGGRAALPADVLPRRRPVAVAAHPPRPAWVGVGVRRRRRRGR